MTAEIIKLADRPGASALQPPRLEGELEYAQRLIGKVVESLREGDLLGTASGLEFAAHYLRRLESRPQDPEHTIAGRMQYGRSFGETLLGWIRLVPLQWRCGKKKIGSISTHGRCLAGLAQFDPL